MDINDWRSLATVASFVMFIVIMRWAYSHRNRHHFDEAAQLPFMHEDHPPVAQKSEETQ